MKNINSKIAFFFSILLVFSLVLVGILTYQKIVVTGSLEKREELLTATVFELSKKGYTKDDIVKVNIVYDYFTGGDTPYEAVVRFKKDPQNTYYYGWEDVKKKAVVFDGKNSF
ncbi:hypothetical protein ACN6MY_20665 [Peribacillus sp. B-H-3]|jgi:hypothetical protein|uniref:hypothetical protein n=1 Tax=Peribacillus sp. B-H-3 TaxID=3400420 RepID=UPI003B01875F